MTQSEPNESSDTNSSERHVDDRVTWQAFPVLPNYEVLTPKRSTWIVNLNSAWVDEILKCVFSQRGFTVSALGKCDSLKPEICLDFGSAAINTPLEIYTSESHASFGIVQVRSSCFKGKIKCFLKSLMSSLSDLGAERVHFFCTESDRAKTDSEISTNTWTRSIVLPFNESTSGFDFEELSNGMLKALLKDKRIVNQKVQAEICVAFSASGISSLTHVEIAQMLESRDGRVPWVHEIYSRISEVLFD